MLGVGTGCPEERAAASASGLYTRNAIRGAQYSLPEYLTRAAGQPLGGERTRNLIAAMRIAEGALMPEQRADLQRDVICVREPPEVRAYFGSSSGFLATCFIS
ncbi:MAG: hypothetical protein IV086_12960 [Hyphomonadaceae bacterium]|nr:MAG: hypothetical protein FD160_2536 [Caulobacteraceae bacterium]MBT9446605.1 hypothetical protein [Hyphomonadaceae bacterium]TPW05426.1 MAG: hypothetical protein FD124_2169 [Alphaproteobacteria bacterium]